MYQFPKTCGECAFVAHRPPVWQCRALPTPGHNTGSSLDAYPHTSPETPACGRFEPAVIWTSAQTPEPGVIMLKSHTTNSSTGQRQTILETTAEIRLLDMDSNPRVIIRINGETVADDRMPSGTTMEQVARMANALAGDHLKDHNRANHIASNIGSNARAHPETWPAEFESIAQGMGVTSA